MLRLIVGFLPWIIFGALGSAPYTWSLLRVALFVFG